jgi:hypothetical protein
MLVPVLPELTYDREVTQKVFNTPPASDRHKTEKEK